jgi:hypothetical protein
MDLTLAWHSNVDRDIEAATLRNQPEMVRRLNFGLDKGTMLMESWLLRSGGSVIQSGGVDGQASVPADHLDELLDVLRQYQEATESSVAVGVGAESAEALTALRVARHRGGNPSVVLYTPEVAQEADRDQDGELDPILPAETDALEGEHQPDAPVPSGTMQKAQFGNQPSPGEATKIQQGAVSASHAQPSAPSPVSPPPAPASPSDSSPPPQAGGQPPQGDQLLQAVGQVLMDVKKQLPTLEELKQHNPQAYDSIVAMTQAVIALAQKLTGGAAPGGAPVQKSEGLEKSLHDLHYKCEYCDKPGTKALRWAEGMAFIPACDEHLERAREQIQKQYGKPDGEVELDKGEPGAARPLKPLRPTPSGHHNLNLPPGSQRDQRVKVVHADGSMSWVEVKAGQVTSEDGHPISSRNPGGR